MENFNNTGKVLGALILGAAIGGTLGILFAPDKGTETRKKLAGKTDELADSLKQKFNDMIEEAKHEMEVANLKAMQYADNNKVK
jgi:gas vesicle protein